MVLGGSRAIGTHRPDSDWDLGVFYRGSQRPLDPGDLRRLGHPGHVSELGEWGPIMHGGAWLTVDGTPIDVLFRDLDTVEHWVAEAQAGRFEVLSQNGYIVGAPTYVLVGELAICQPIVGDLAPPELHDCACGYRTQRWLGRASVALMFAQVHARAADALCCVGMLAESALCVAHARLAERREWVLNEKGLVRRAGLAEVQSLLVRPGATSAELMDAVAAVGAALGAEPLAVR